MSKRSPSSFRRVPSTFEKKGSFFWGLGHHIIRCEEASAYVFSIEFEQITSTPCVLSLSVFHSSNSLTEYELVEVTLPSPKSNVSNTLSLTSPNVIVSHGQREIGLFENLSSSNICNFEFACGYTIQMKVKVTYNTYVPENDPLIRELNRCPTPQLGTDLESLLSSGHSADVRIKVGSGEIPAHKLILCAQRSLLQKNQGPAQVGTGLYSSQVPEFGLASLVSSHVKVLDGFEPEYLKNCSDYDH